jgi:glucokinase
MMNILTADIGGTHSRFARFVIDQEGGLTMGKLTWLKTADAKSFGQLMHNLLSSDQSLRLKGDDIFVIAIAGPIEDGVRSSPPLITWDIDISGARGKYGLERCLLINDFVAQAYFCRTPVAGDVEKVLAGSAAEGGTIAVIGAGTGLGQAALMSDGKENFIAIPSEGGHTNFPFVTKQEVEFLEFLIRKRGEKYITCNTVVSGGGLSYIHQFLTGETLEPSEVIMRFSRHPETITWASRFYGRVCRNYALQTLSVGGLYIAGGLAANAPQLVSHDAFRHEFHSSDTLTFLLEKIPVFLIKNQNSGLWGAALYGLQQLKRN